MGGIEGHYPFCAMACLIFNQEAAGISFGEKHGFEWQRHWRLIYFV